MRKSLILFLLAATLAAPAAWAQKLGQRTAPPEQAMAGIGEGSSDAEYERELAAAAAFPLGSLQNPVRVAGPEGERAYLARLRCADGAIPRIGAQRPGAAGGFGNIVEIAPLDCGAAAPGRTEIFLDIYHEEHVETAAPPGLRFMPR
ncbi:MAG: hypothetical protein JWO81_3081 [Alphaproteobacteria bacterium]|nr:hypothetical protein [Alphaproteobacteria bacterium]